MSNEEATLERLLEAVSFLVRDHVADRSTIAPTCRACGQNYPCLSERVAQNAVYFGALHLGQLPEQIAEMPTNLAWALRHIDEWISASGDYTGEMAQVLDDLHHLVIAEGVKCIGAASRAGFAELQFRVRSATGTAVPLWGIVTDADSMFLRINVSHTSESGRAFLGAILTNAFTPVDSDQLIAWWSTLDTSRTRTITTPFPDDTETAVTILGQLVHATYAVTDRIHELVTGGL